MKEEIYEKIEGESLRAHTSDACDEVIGVKKDARGFIFFEMSSVAISALPQSGSISRIHLLKLISSIYATARLELRVSKWPVNSSAWIGVTADQGLLELKRS